MKVEIKRYKSGERAGTIRKNVVEVDGSDVWSLDWTLAQIIAPTLKKLKEDKHGAPNVADEDVPAELRCSPEVDKDEINWEWKDENYFKGNYQFPFDKNFANYWTTKKSSSHYKNPKRVAWVKSKIEDYEKEIV